MRDFALVLAYFTDGMVRMYICCNIAVQSDFCGVNEETKKTLVATFLTYNHCRRVNAR